MNSSKTNWWKVLPPIFMLCFLLFNFQHCGRGFTLSDGQGNDLTGQLTELEGTVPAWFVQNNVAQTGDGSFQKPFLTLKEAEAASKAGDVIIVLPGDGTANNLDQGIILKDNQRLFGPQTGQLEFNGIQVFASGISDVVTLTNTSGKQALPTSTNETPFERMPVSSSTNNSVVYLANNNEVAGFNIDVPIGKAGISCSECIATNIHHNKFVADDLPPSNDALILEKPDGQIRFHNNEITADVISGITFTIGYNNFRPQAANAASTTTPDLVLEVANNIIGSLRNGMRVLSDNSRSFDYVVKENTFTSRDNSAGLFGQGLNTLQPRNTQVAALADHVINFTLEDNTFNINNPAATSDLRLVVAQNTLETVNFTAKRNTFNVVAPGITADTASVTAFTFGNHYSVVEGIFNVVIEENTYSGFDKARLVNGAALDRRGSIDISKNVGSSTQGRQFIHLEFGGLDVDNRVVTIKENTFSGSDFLYINGYNDRVFADVQSNTINMALGNNPHPIRILSSSPEFNSVIFRNNTFNFVSAEEDDQDSNSSDDQLYNLQHHPEFTIHYSGYGAGFCLQSTGNTFGEVFDGSEPNGNVLTRLIAEDDIQAHRHGANILEGLRGDYGTNNTNGRLISDGILVDGASSGTCASMFPSDDTGTATGTGTSTGSGSGTGSGTATGTGSGTSTGTGTNTGTGTGTSTGITPSASSFDFGTQVVNAPVSAASQFSFVNNGPEAASGCFPVSISGADANQFSVTQDNCGSTDLNTGASCTFGVSFNPTSEGAKSAQATRACITGGVRKVVLTGNAYIPAPELTISDDKDLGSINLGEQSPSSQFFTVTNNGNLGATACQINVTGDTDIFSLENPSTTCNNTLAPGSSCVIDVRFDPRFSIVSAAGVKSGSLSYTCTNHAPITAGLTATFVDNFPELESSPSSHDFGNIATGQQSPVRNLSFRNTSVSVTATHCAMTLSGANADQFHRVGTCSGPISPNAFCDDGIHYQPTQVGSHSATLTYTCGTKSASIALSGTGVVPAPNLSSNHDGRFGSVPLGGFNTSTRTVPISNNGTADATGCQVGMTGDTHIFSVINANTTCGSTLATGESCNIGVLFDPRFPNVSTTGPKIATLTYACANHATVSTLFTAIFQDHFPALRVTPSNYDFGSVTTGSQSPEWFFIFETESIQIGTPDATHCSPPFLSGPNADQFSLITTICVETLRSRRNGGECYGIVRHQPTQAGSHTANLTLTCGTQSATATLTGTGTAPAPDISVSNNGNYGAVDIGGNGVNRSITFTNNGPADATGCSYSLTGDTDVFSSAPAHSTCGATLSAGSSCHVNLNGTARFPEITTEGIRNAALTYNCSNHDPVVLNATVLVRDSYPGILFTPQSHDFGSVMVNQTSAIHNFHMGVQSATSGTEHCSLVSITGSDASHFAIITSSCTPEMNFGSSCNVGVRYNPTSAGNHSATMTRTCATKTTTATLTGTGTAADQPPVITCPVDQTFTSSVSINYPGPNATATDDNDPSPTIVQSPSVLPSGVTTTITATATDNLNQSSQCTFNVTVVPVDQSSNPGCQPGHEPSQFTANSCDACSAGTVSAGGFASCQNCPAGQQPNANASACEPANACPPGQTPTGTNGACCVPGDLTCEGGNQGGGSCAPFDIACCDQNPFDENCNSFF